MEILADSRRGSDRKAVTGHHAPTSGWWRPEGDPLPFRYLQRGEIMPAFEGAQALWELVYEIDPTRRARI